MNFLVVEERSDSRTAGQSIVAVAPDARLGSTVASVVCGL